MEMERRGLCPNQCHWVSMEYASWAFRDPSGIDWGTNRSEDGPGPGQVRVTAIVTT